MKNDSEVKLYMSERSKGKSQQLAAARAGMSERTARKYEQAGKLPSELKRPHDWKTRTNPFEEDWPWVVEHLERDPALQASTLFALLCEKHPGRYRPTQDRTLRRHIARWRALHGPDQEVSLNNSIPQENELNLILRTWKILQVTIAGEPFPHLFYHFVLTYSNAEAVSLCFSETFEALAEGIEKALWQIGGVPLQHRTDHLSAAVRQLTQRGAGRVDSAVSGANGSLRHATDAGTMSASHMRTAMSNNPIAASKRRLIRHCGFEAAVILRHALPMNASCMISFTNAIKRECPRFTAEKAALCPLPVTPLSPCKELRITVSRFSTILWAATCILFLHA